MTSRIALVPLLALAIGCSDVAVGEQTSSVRLALVNCTTGALGLAPLLNTCGIGLVGPFGDEDGTGSDDEPISANSNLTFAAAEPALHAAQVAYTVNLPGNGGTGAVKFVAADSQDYSIATDVTVNVVVRDTGGTAITPLVQQNIEATCNAAADTYPEPPDGTAMVQVRVYPLTAGTTYVIAFSGSAEDEFHVAVDEPNDFLNAYYPDSDGDGFGNYRGSPLITECSAAAGFVPNGDDCNDASSTVFPGAPEIPGAGDNNCDGVPDGDTVVSDLAIRDVLVLDGPTKFRLGGPAGRVEVRYRYVNRGPSLMDATVTTTADGVGLGVRNPDRIFDVPDLMPVRIEENVQSYKVRCPKPRKHRHPHLHPPPTPAEQVRTLTFTAEIEPADPADVDALPANNVGEAAVDLTCVDCKQFEHRHRSHCPHARDHHFGCTCPDIPAVCRRPRDPHHGHGRDDDHGHGDFHGHGRGNGHGDFHDHGH